MMQLQIGQQVMGHYFNVAFTGVVLHVRPHTINNNFVIHIGLDAAIDVYGEKRRVLAMEVSAEGCGAGYPGLVRASDPITAYYSQSSMRGQPQRMPR